MMRVFAWLPAKALYGVRRVSHRWLKAADAAAVNVVLLPRGKPAMSSIVSVMCARWVTADELKSLVTARHPHLHRMAARSLRLYGARDRKAVLGRNDMLMEAMEEQGVELDDPSKSVAVVVDQPV